MNQDFVRKNRLILIRGLPGSGKSTFAKFLCVNIDSCFRAEADMWFELYNNNIFDKMKLEEAHNWCKSEVIRYLKDSCDVVVSNTSTTEKEVAVYQKIANEYNAEFVSIIVENRHGNSSVHNVPESTMQNMKNRFTVKI